MHAEQIVRKYQERILPITKEHLVNSKIVDVGCGTGLVAVHLSNSFSCEVHLCDVQDLRTKASMNLPFTLLKDGRLPFADESFDVAYVQFVLHHIQNADDIHLLLSEIHRVASRSVVVVEELSTEQTNYAHAKAFDEAVNRLLVPEQEMPVFRYLTNEEMQNFLSTAGFCNVNSFLVDVGDERNGWLATRVVVGVKKKSIYLR